jgi:hypothetical protein
VAFGAVLEAGEGEVLGQTVGLAGGDGHVASRGAGRGEGAGGGLVGAAEVGPRGGCG